MSSAEEKGSNLHQYFENTFHQRLVRQSQEQKYDATMLTPATRLLQKRREMDKVEADLRAQKTEHTIRMDALQQRKELLQQKEDTLTESLRRFDRFLKENDARRKRALRKTRDEREACLQKDEEITNLNYDLGDLRDVRQKQRDAISKQEFYEKYLKLVLEETDEFSEINELIDRYVTLHLTNKDLVALDSQCQERMETQTKRLGSRKEEHRVAILGLNTKLGELTTRKEKAEKETLYWEAQAQSAEQNATKRTLLLGRIRMATANLYTLVNAHAPGNIERIPGTEKQLEKIQVFIKDLEDVVNDFEHDMAEQAAETNEGHLAAMSDDPGPSGKKKKKKSGKKKK